MYRLRYRSLCNMLLLLLLTTTAAEIPHKHATSFTKNITSCPDVGYFFQREVPPNAIQPGPCLLCFCKTNTAVCWKRESRRCDKKSYTHYGKREARYRRSPGFTDIFFRDAARDVLDKRLPEQCKPYESSFSEGCPPADWCIGCTVCDCDANGRWDCHILSFCPDKNGNKQEKKKKIGTRTKNINRRNIGAKSKAKGQSRPNNKPPIKSSKIFKTTKPPKKINKNGIVKKPQVKRTPNLKKGPIKKVQAKKISEIKKNTRKIQKRTTTKAPSKKVIKKKPAIKKANVNSYREILQNAKGKNDTYKLAEAIVQKVMSNVEKIMNENQAKINKAKVIQKRSMSKHFDETKKSRSKIKQKSFKKQKRTWNQEVPYKNKPNYNRRAKRSIKDNFFTVNPLDLAKVNISCENETEIQILDITEKNYSRATTIPPEKYYKYDLNTEIVRKIENLNKDLSKDSNSTVLSAVVNISNIKLSNEHTFNSNSKRKKFEETSGNLDKTTTKNTRNMLSFNSSTTLYNVTKPLRHNTKCGRVCTFIKNHFFSSTRNTSTAVGVKEKKSLLATVKNIFKPLFATDQPRRKKFINKKNTKHRHLLNAICRKFHLCHPNLRNKLLQSKLSDLHRETYKILKIVSSIKGLLYLLKNKEKERLINNATNDLDKLDIILREYYDMDKINKNLTETQRTQIKYVKQNIQEFVKSLEKFALILNDIIRILEKQDKTESNKNIGHRELIPEKQLIEDKISRLKTLLLNYNSVQNKFMSKMLNVLTSLQMRDTTPKVSEQKSFFNNSLQFEAYSRNILENLRKLKALGQKLSFSGRAKRETMGDEDAVEYLLMLMEYLLKQNKNIINPPVSDGIDLLIDAIKNAPEIKPIKFIDIKLTSTQVPPTRTESTENVSYNKVKNTRNNEDEYSLKKINPVLEFYKNDEDKIKNGPKMNEKLVKSAYNKKIRHFHIEDSEKKVEEEKETTIAVYINKEDKPDNLEEKFKHHKFEVYNAENDEDDENDVRTKKENITLYDDNYPKTDLDIEKEHEKLINQISDVTVKISDAMKENEKQSNLVWGEEINDEVKLSESTPKNFVQKTPRPQFVATKTERKYIDKYSNPISGISSEEIDTHIHPRKKTNIGKASKIDIFNSFDYNTEKNEPDSGSKEDKNDAFSDFT